MLLVLSSFSCTRIKEIDNHGNPVTDYRLKSGKYAIAIDNLDRIIIMSEKDEVQCLDADYEPIYTAGHTFRWNHIFKLRFIRETQECLIGGCGFRHIHGNYNHERELVSFFRIVQRPSPK